MKPLPLALFALLCGCATTQLPDDTPMRPGGPDWAAVDKSVERVKERERNKPRLTETERTSEAGFPTMTDEDYATALDTARGEVKKANPKMSESDIETEATKRAEEAKRQHENTFSRSTSVKYELKTPEPAK